MHLVAFKFIALTIVICCGFVSYVKSDVTTESIIDDKPISENSITNNVDNNEDFTSPIFWTNDAQITLKNKIEQIVNTNYAKNIIFFLGDGMSLPTVTASRIYEGQQKGIVGERNHLAWETFPYVGLSKTYCVNKQVSDSACTSTAYLCGIKANYKTIGLSANVTFKDCLGEKYKDNRVDSIMAWAQAAGKATGIVTTTRVTHASPAGAYAHTSHRDFESDYDIVQLNGDPNICEDIANQMIRNNVSRNFKVILGGGTKKFLPNGTMDSKGDSGERLDGRDLIKEWSANKKGIAKTAFNRPELMSINFDKTDYLLGLFASNHLPYHLDSDPTIDPSLSDMTEAAVKILQKSKKGFVLFVEGGRIDMAHHDTKAHKALDETVEFSKAIQLAKNLTDPQNTLIVVTADHSHTMTISGYSNLGSSITGLNTELSDTDNLPYTTLSYANGPSFRKHIKTDGKREDLKNQNYENKNFEYPSSVPLISETHGGDDVPVYATGPWAHLFTGVIEENAIPHLMGYASCIGSGLHMCQNNKVFN